MVPTTLLVAAGEHWDSAGWEAQPEWGWRKLGAAAEMHGTQLQKVSAGLQRGRAECRNSPRLGPWHEERRSFLTHGRGSTCKHCMNVHHSKRIDNRSNFEKTTCQEALSTPQPQFDCSFVEFPWETCNCHMAANLCVKYNMSFGSQNAPECTSSMIDLQVSLANSHCKEISKLLKSF